VQGSTPMMAHRLNLHISKKTLLICVVLFIAAFAVYSVTGEGHATFYNYYVRLSDAFLHGRLYLLENPSWLNELVPNPSGPGYYVVYPPLPAFLMTPFVALVGWENFSQTMFSVFFGALTVVVAYLVTRDLLKKPDGTPSKYLSTPIWGAILFGFSTLFWWLASNGSVWLIAQAMSAFFLLLGIHEAFGKARPLLMGLLVGASFWCRLPTILGIFFFAGLIISRQQLPDDFRPRGLSWLSTSLNELSLPMRIARLIFNSVQKLAAKTRLAIKPLFLLAVGVGVFVAFDMAYNYARFGAFFDVAYWMIPGILNEPWFSKGLFSLEYIIDNLRPFLTGLPTLNSTFPYLHPSIVGLAIWFTTPAFIFALRSKIKDAVTWSAWIAILGIAFVIFTKGLSGWGFGYRYAMDFYPFLFILTIRGMGEKLRWYHILLIVLGVAVNLWGTLGANLLPHTFWA
jgi:hypothetical protein